jgi:hypothetical protein
VRREIVIVVNPPGGFAASVDPLVRSGRVHSIDEWPPSQAAPAKAACDVWRRNKEKQDVRAFSSEVEAGSREENASK